MFHNFHILNVLKETINHPQKRRSTFLQFPYHQRTNLLPPVKGHTTHLIIQLEEYQNFINRVTLNPQLPLEKMTACRTKKIRNSLLIHWNVTQEDDIFACVIFGKIIIFLLFSKRDPIMG